MIKLFQRGGRKDQPPGCAFALTTFVTFLFLVFFPLAFIFVNSVQLMYHNSVKDRMRSTGVEMQAEVLDKRPSQHAFVVVEYQVPGTTLGKRTEVVTHAMYDRIAIGDRIPVWVAGSETKIVTPNTRYPWVLHVVLAIVAMLGCLLTLKLLLRRAHAVAHARAG